jgi:hypothetical protein
MMQLKSSLGMLIDLKYYLKEDVFVCILIAKKYIGFDTGVNFS